MPTTFRPGLTWLPIEVPASELPDDYKGTVNIEVCVPAGEAVPDIARLAEYPLYFDPDTCKDLSKCASVRAAINKARAERLRAQADKLDPPGEPDALPSDVLTTDVLATLEVGELEPGDFIVSMVQVTKTKAPRHEHGVLRRAYQTNDGTWHDSPVGKTVCTVATQTQED